MRVIAVPKFIPKQVQEHRDFTYIGPILNGAADLALGYAQQPTLFWNATDDPLYFESWSLTTVVNQVRYWEGTAYEAYDELPWAEVDEYLSTAKNAAKVLATRRGYGHLFPAQVSNSMYY